VTQLHRTAAAAAAATAGGGMMKNIKVSM
jgi:hypothetical protein